MTDSEAAQLQNAALWAFEHFEALDRANARIHCSPTRYSPITFRLAEALAASGVLLNECGPLETVLGDSGQYPEDRGRVELEDQG